MKLARAQWRKGCPTCRTTCTYEDKSAQGLYIHYKQVVYTDLILTDSFLLLSPHQTDQASRIVSNASKITSAIASATPQSFPPGENNNNNDRNLGTGDIIGISIGIASFISAIIIGYLQIRKKKEKNTVSGTYFVARLLEMFKIRCIGRGLSV